jgi:hypothetical protein
MDLSRGLGDVYKRQVCALITVVFRVLAIWNDWTLPAWRND